MFEQIALDPLVVAVAALFGVLFGLLLGRLFLPGPREVNRLRSEIEKLNGEHAEYQGRVATHFRKTGDLISQMTQSYKAVYEHLADGAQSLCSADALPKPTFNAPRLIVDDSLSIGPEGARPQARSETAPADAVSHTATLPRVEEPADGALVTPTEGVAAHDAIKSA